jgi:hypothetical protein
MYIPLLPPRMALTPSSAPSPAPIPYPQTPKYQPGQWVYSDSFGINGQPRLGVAVVHDLTCTSIYIDVGGTYETRTGQRAELMAIYTALNKYATHEWVGIFTDSLPSLRAI